MFGGFDKTAGAYYSTVGVSYVLHCNLLTQGSHAGHIPYLWQGALSIASQTLLVMGATMSPSLSAILSTLVPHLDAVDAIINDVVTEVERYVHLAPSLSLSAEIIREAEMRRRAYLGT